METYEVGEGEEVYMWPESTETPEEDLVYHKQCPLSLLLKYMPQYSEVLELYYHCKLCSAPQAYLEQQAFLEHVQQFHADYYKPDDTPLLVVYPESKTASAQASEEEINQTQSSEPNPDPEPQDASPAAENKLEIVSIPVATDRPVSPATAGDASPVPKYRPESPVTAVELPLEAEETPLLPAQPEPMSAAVGRGLQDDKPMRPMRDEDETDATVVAIKQEEESPKMKSITRSIRKEILQRLAEQQTRPDAYTPEVTVSIKKEKVTSPDGTSQGENYVIDDVELKIEGLTEQEEEEERLRQEEEEEERLSQEERLREELSQDTTASEDTTLKDEDLEAIAEFEAKSSSDFNISQDSILELKPHLVDLKLPPGHSRCRVCRKGYKPWHVPECVRDHDTEKPSCDAYVCVARHSQPVHPCRFCDTFFLTKVRLKEHIKMHAQSYAGSMNCKECGKPFSSMTRYLAHIGTCEAAQPTACPECGKMFVSKKNMLKHANNIHFASGAHICDYCGKTFNCRGNLMTHLRVHTGEKPYKCEVCGLSFRARPNLLRHSMRHTGNKPHQCDQCDKGFADKSTLARHKMVHSAEREAKRRSCRHCDLVLKSERLLIKHIQEQHADVEPDAGYTCDVCHKLFRDKHNMEAHKMIHTGERPFPCPKCNKSFRKNADLTIHYRIHTGHKPYKCDICEACFTTNSNMLKHRMSHTGERPHKCETCGRCFIDKSHLNRHYLTHTGEKPHVCQVCERGFATKAQLQQHMLIHTGEKPFICGACGKAFRQKAKAQRHRCLWKVIQKPGQGGGAHANYAMMESGNVLVQMDESMTRDSSGRPLAMRVVDPQSGGGGDQAGGEQVAYQFIQEGEDGIAYQIIESAEASGEQVIRMLQGGGDGEQVAYEIVDEAGEAVAGDQIVRVMDEAGRAITAGESGVSFQVVDPQGAQVAGGEQAVTVQYGDQIVTQA